MPMRIFSGVVLARRGASRRRTAESVMNSRRLIASPQSQGDGILAAQKPLPQCTANVRFGSKADMCVQNAMSALPPKADIVCDKVRIMKPVTIASVRAHGVRQVLVYCNGNREGDWPGPAGPRGDLGLGSFPPSRDPGALSRQRNKIRRWPGGSTSCPIGQRPVSRSCRGSRARRRWLAPRHCP